MQYLQKFIQKDLGFGYSFDTPLSSYDSSELWSLHHGKSKETSEPALLFHYDPSKHPSQSNHHTLAKSHLQRLKTLRHPDILKFLSAVEGNDGTIYIATEHATPLATLLAQQPNMNRDAIQWGLLTISRALGFLHSSGLVHGRLNAATVFVTPAGDWKLGGLDCVTQHTQAMSLGQHAASLQHAAYQSPEMARGDWKAVQSGPASAVDSWALGCLMYEAHAGRLTGAEQLQDVASLPKQIVSAYRKLLAADVGARAPAGELVNHPYWQRAKFVELNVFVENWALKGPLEREAFLGKLPAVMDRLPDSFCTSKILPVLSQSVEGGGGGGPALTCVVKMRDRLGEGEFGKVVGKYVGGWYGNQNLDRALKVELYAQMDLFEPYLDEGVVNSAVFPAMCAAFQDMQAPALRDGAVKAVLAVSSKLSDRNLNSGLMSHFARLQVDPEPAIRTNTTVCLGKMASRLSPSARNKVLAAAFLRSLKDPFPHARAAGINAIMITTDMYPVKEIATRLLPAVIPLLVDGSGEVRTLAFKVLADFEKKLQRNHEEMSRAEEASASRKAQNGEAAKAGGASGGWGLSSFSSMTAALLSSNKGESNAPASTSTGISSDDFRKGRASGNETMKEVNGRGNSAGASMGAGTGVSSDSWGTSNGNASGTTNTAPPAAFAATPLAAGQSSFGELGGLGKDGGEGLLDDDDDEDGWGDMDIKADGKESQAMDEEDLFVAMMGKPPSKPSVVPGGLSRSTSNASSTGGSKTSGGGSDLWDLAPPLVSKPKPRPPARSTTRPAATTTSGMGMGTASSRRNKKSTGDDWEALLGGSGTTGRRKVAGRGPR